MKQFVVISLLLLAATALEAFGSHEQSKPAPPAAHPTVPTPGAQAQSTAQHGPGSNVPNQHQPHNPTQAGGNSLNVQPQHPSKPAGNVPQHPPTPAGNLPKKPQTQTQPGGQKQAAASTSKYGAPKATKTTYLQNRYNSGAKSGKPISTNKPGFESTPGNPFGNDKQLKRTCFQSPCYEPNAPCKGVWRTVLYVVGTSTQRRAKYIGYQCRATPFAKKV